MIKTARMIFVVLLVATFFLGPLLTARAHHAVLHFNLEEMVATSDRVFIGTCVDIKETKEMISQGLLPVTKYTFAVTDVLKGKVPQQFTFKQLGHRGHKPSGKKNLPIIGGYVADPKTYIHGMSHYQIGDEILLMLIPQYMDGQVTYPVGLYQGAFFITRSASGKATLKNSINNRGLFTNPYTNYSKSASGAKIIYPDADRPILGAQLSPQSLETLISKPGALPLDDFTSLVRRIVEAEK
ncbi:MAG: hypothetical protein AB1489_27070 [Acidobacteriota bacterium]